MKARPRTGLCGSRPAGHPGPTLVEVILRVDHCQAVTAEQEQVVTLPGEVSHVDHDQVGALLQEILRVDRDQVVALLQGILRVDHDQVMTLLAESRRTAGKGTKEMINLSRSRPRGPQ